MVGEVGEVVRLWGWGSVVECHCFVVIGIVCYGMCGTVYVCVCVGGLLSSWVFRLITFKNLSN